MSDADQAVLEDAMQQLEDCISFANGSELLDPEECGVTPLEQVEATRNAMRKAGRVITKWRRRLVKTSGARDDGPKDGE